MSLNARLFVGYGRDVSLNGNVFILNKTILQGDVSINSRLFVALDCSVNGNLQIKGRSTFGDCLLNGNTTFTNLPTSSATPSLSNQSVTKTYVDSAVSGVNTSLLLGTSNTWTNSNIFTGKVLAGDNNYYNLQYGFDTFNTLSTPSFTPNTAIANTALGVAALTYCTTGSNNTGVGASALHVTSSGKDNVGIGGSALVLNTTGSNNTGIGSSSSAQNTTGSRNVGVGIKTLFFNQTGNDNVAIGYNALNGANTTSFSQNVAIGSLALQNITTGTNNVVIGYNSATNNQTNTNCTWIGASTLMTNALNQSTVIGYGASATASNQLVLGTAAETVKIAGNLSLLTPVITDTVYKNVGYGFEALKNGFAGCGSQNVAIGYQTGYSLNTSAVCNTLVGLQAGNYATSAFNCTYIGYQAGLGVSTGSTGYSNTFTGYISGKQISNGTDNAFYGKSSGENISSGSRNTFLGALAGNANTTYNNSTCVGYNSQCSGNNQVVLGTASETVLIPGGVGGGLAINYTSLPAQISTNQSCIGFTATTSAGSLTGTAAVTLSVCNIALLAGVYLCVFVVTATDNSHSGNQYLHSYINTDNSNSSNYQTYAVMGGSQWTTQLTNTGVISLSASGSRIYGTVWAGAALGAVSGFLSVTRIA